MDEKQCPKCKRRSPARRRLCKCGNDLLEVALFDPSVGGIGIDTNLEPTIGIAPGVSMDIGDGGINVFGIDGGQLAGLGGAVADAAGTVAGAAGDVLGGAADVAGDVIEGVASVAGDVISEI